ncbi:MAG: helix-turn-helix transcriptional regulator [Bacilli bacterium]|nr:helix-turn-helix transcriptional regulator [Bacilli bacterium]
MKQTHTIDEQEKIYFNSLTGKEKRDYYIAYFASEIVFALKGIRVEKKLTQKEVADKMGLKQAYVSKIENMEKMPTIETIAKYLFALNYSLDDSKALIEDLVKTLTEARDNVGKESLPRVVVCFTQKKANKQYGQNYQQTSEAKLSLI